MTEIITLCGSTKFKKEFEEVERKLTLEGKIVLSVGIFNHTDNEQLTPEQMEMLDEVSLRKIDLSNSIYVIDVDKYIGESTKKDIEYATKMGKTIYYYSKEEQS